jgi:hypothetical protein
MTWTPAAAMKPWFAVAVGLAMAAASCIGPGKGVVNMSSMAGSAAEEDGNRGLTLRPVRIAGARAIDGLKLVEAAGQPTLLYSTQAETPDRRYELVIRAAPIADMTRATEVARIGRMLPTPPQWDARPVGDRYEIVYEMAGGAVNAVLFQDGQGNTRRVSDEHPFESFTRPHFVRAGRGSTTDVGAVADLKKVVVFPRGTIQSAAYTALADGADGIVGGTMDRWVVAKSAMSGAALFDTLPGRLTLSWVGATDVRRIMVPDLLVYELDAAPLANDIVVFATSKPALLIRDRRLDRPYQLAAEDRRWLLWLSQPTILVTAQSVHLAALAHPGRDEAVVLYAAMPITALGGP